MILYPLIYIIPRLLSLLFTTVVHAQLPVPSNDECVNATVIPTDTKLLPYISPEVDFGLATVRTIDSNGNCNGFDISYWVSVWYQWIPSTTDIYSFSNDMVEPDTSIQLFRGTDCGSLVEIGCDVDSPPYVDLRLIANETYYIKMSNYYNIDEKFHIYLNNTFPPPSNAICSNAAAVTLGEEVTGNFAFTAFDIPKNDIECSAYKVGNPALWYKVTNTLPTQIAILASTCYPSTTIDTVVTVFEGNNTCTALNSTCVGGNDNHWVLEYCSGANFLFLAKPFTTYYIVVQPFDVPAFGNFTMTIQTKQDYFLLIDSTSDQIIDVIRNDVILAGGNQYNFDYSKIKSLNLNIEAVFDNSKNAVQSVMVSFDDDPKYAHCETRPPFYVFMDTDGDLIDGIITPGPHSVTATSYSQSDCKGVITSTLYEQFYMDHCPMEVLFYQVSRGALLYNTSGRFYAKSLPCNDIAIEVVPHCGFVIEEVKLTLHRYLFTITTGMLRSLVYRILRLIFDESELRRVIKIQTESEAPYYLFGSSTGNVVNTGTINAGAYDMEISINGVYMSKLFLFVLNDCDHPL